MASYSAVVYNEKKMYNLQQLANGNIEILQKAIAWNWQCNGNFEEGTEINSSQITIVVWCRKPSSIKPQPRNSKSMIVHKSRSPETASVLMMNVSMSR